MDNFSTCEIFCILDDMPENIQNKLNISQIADKLLKDASVRCESNRTFVTVRLIVFDTVIQILFEICYSLEM